MRGRRWLGLARKAIGRPPSVVARHAWHEFQRQAQRPWARLRPRWLSERRLLSACRADSIDELWSRCLATPFPWGSSSRDEIAGAFRDRFPELVRTLIEQAETILRHEFDLLGSGPRALGPRLPWHADFKSDTVWPLGYCHDLDYNDLERPSDVKVPWELSRMQHLARLGQAYCLTRDERYGSEFRDEVEDWCAGNPLGYGVNWSCTMDVALRAASWVWAVHLFADSQAVRATPFRLQFLRTLYLHGEFIERNLEYSEVRGNHYLVDGVGLLFVASLFRGAPAAERWWSLGRRIVLEEMLLQVEPDGVDGEQSTAYHRLVLEGFLTAYLLLKAHGERIPEAQWTRLARMCEVVAAVTKPDGRVPLLGDADDGRIQKLGLQEISDHRYLLSTAAAIFGRGAFKSAGDRLWDETLWLLGASGVAAWDALARDSVETLPTVFPAGGWYVLRGPESHVFVDCAEVGLRGRGGHGHNDILSFELYLGGMNVVTDCGAYLYTASREWRNRFRSTAFHNTVQVDEEEINRFPSPDDLWRLHADASPLGAAVEDDGEVGRFSGCHSGYERLTPGVRHCRRVVLDRAAGRVAIVDRLAGASTRRLTWRAHLDPAVRASLEPQGIRLTGRSTVWCQAIEAPSSAVLSLEDGWVSPSYGVRVPTQTIVCRAEASLPATFAIVFATAPVSASDVQRMKTGAWV